MPIRIQRKRTKGWKMPPNTVYVGRPGRWGNPFSGSALAQLAAVFFGGRGDVPYDRARGLVGLYAHWLNGFPNGIPMLLAVLINKRLPLPPTIGEIAELRGKNLACFCPLDQPCHADVLLDLANADRM